MGCPDPELLEDCITVKTLNRWEQYEKQSGYRNDIHWGMVMALLANIHRGKDDPAYKPADFMPYFEEPLPDPEELQSRIKRLIKEKKQINDCPNA